MRRPTSIDEMQRCTRKFVTDEGFERGLSYRPDPTDIFISPYAKCGTTWMQQIIHGLRTGGSMAFAEITEVVPWLELAHDMGIDVNAPQVASPRAFKSHLGWENIPKGGRYIVVFRDPVDAMVSMYRFCEGWWFEQGAVSISDFADYYLGREGDYGYWAHAASWWRQRDRPDVFLITFEAMKQDLAGVVHRLADFMGGGISAEVCALATKQAGFGFMKAHGRQFDDHLVRQTRDAACELPEGGQSTKVNQGQTGGNVQLITPEIQKKLAAKWQETMTVEFGLTTYQKLAQQLQR